MARSEPQKSLVDLCRVAWPLQGLQAGPGCPRAVAVAGALHQQGLLGLAAQGE